jgi:hypothetical protein
MANALAVTITPLSDPRAKVVMPHSISLASRKAAVLHGRCNVFGAQ